MNTKAWTMALLTVLIWGTTFAAIRVSLHGGYEAGHLVLVRYLIASALFLLYALWPGVRFRLPHRKDLPKIFGLSLIGISVYHIGITFGEQTISAGTAGMLIGSAPIFTAIIAMLVLKERPGTAGWLGLVTGFIGILLIMFGTEGGAFSLEWGAILVLISALAASIFFVFQKGLLTRYTSIELTAYFTWAGTIPFFLFAPGVADSISAATAEANWAALYVGIFPAAIGYALWATALSAGNAGSVASVLYLEPAVAVFTAWLLLGEWPTALSVTGGIIALFGVLLVNSFGPKRKEQRVQEEWSHQNS
ncbi:DMT family transporter [Planococcus lenghuensis]|uniref:EamA family transporter n=1 Tax=Planococcus lenghuensis TaxID=2213202 RepID=A0A1Q2L2I9_9BACL|nr:DMT family transporter [Planococcus lenghuensis]AQQ54649.1 EamA family transporter [Planococcus lenghuensis]